MEIHFLLSNHCEGEIKALRWTTVKSGTVITAEADPDGLVHQLRWSRPHRDFFLKTYRDSNKRLGLEAVAADALRGGHGEAGSQLET